MFVEHVPGTILRYFTPAAACIASCTDAFILISGFVCGIVFSKTINRHGVLACWLRVARRCGVLYGAHLATLLTTFGVLVLFSAESLLQPPAQEFIKQAISMQWMPMHFSVLAVYIVLLALSPGLIWLLQRKPGFALAISGALYAVFQLYPQVTDVFREYGMQGWINPLAWQVLYALGAWLGVRKTQGYAPIPELKPALIAALVVTVIGCAWKLVRFAVQLDLGGIGSWLGMPGALLPIPEKINLSPLRLASALATGYVALAVLRRAWRWVPKSLVTPIADCGKHSLTIFCIHILLVYISELILSEAAPLAKQCLVVGTGIAMLVACAWTLTKLARRKNSGTTRVAADHRDVGFQRVSINA